MDHTDTNHPNHLTLLSHSNQDDEVKTANAFDLYENSRRRLRFTDVQRDMLEKEFTLEENPDSDRINEIARGLQVESCRVKMWFTNRKSKGKRRRGTPNIGAVNDSRGTDEPLRKKQRTSYTPEQLIVLKKEFEKNSYIHREELEKLASRLNIEIKKIKYWFNNRRFKLGITRKTYVEKEHRKEDPSNGDLKNNIHQYIDITQEEYNEENLIVKENVEDGGDVLNYSVDVVDSHELHKLNVGKMLKGRSFGDVFKECYDSNCYQCKAGTYLTPQIPQTQDIFNGDNNEMSSDLLSKVVQPPTTNYLSANQFNAFPLSSSLYSSTSSSSNEVSFYNRPYRYVPMQNMNDLEEYRVRYNHLNESSDQNINISQCQNFNTEYCNFSDEFITYVDL